MKKLRIVLADANRRELEGYEKICRSICEKNDVSVTFKFYLNSGDLLFDMNDKDFASSVTMLIIDPENGFDVIPSIVRSNGYDGLILYLSRSKSPEHFRQAFDASAFNFIQKGTSQKLLARFHSIFESAIHTAKQNDRQYLAASYAGEYRRIEVTDILYFEAAADHTINVVYKGGSFQFRSTMKSLEEQLVGRGFIRAHRCYFVSIDAIHRVDPDGLTLNNGFKIIVSRDRYASLKTAILNWQT